ncbi:MAG TPA: SMC-Scp complex subunit ScpB [Candidatus Paceibacterota bacterium]
MTLDQKIEAILFMKGEPMTHKKLSELCDASKDEIEVALRDFEAKLQDRGLTLIHKEGSVMLGTNPELGSMLENMRKEELSRELSKASLETVAVILYKEGATRADIDYIRGVNSSFILRNLLVRGLVEKITDPTDSRRYLYKPSYDLMSYLGLSKLSELPEFENMKIILNKNAREAEEENVEI